MEEILQKAFKENGLVAAFAIVGLVVLISGFLSRRVAVAELPRNAMGKVTKPALRTMCESARR